MSKNYCTTTLFQRRSQLSLAICYYFCPSYFLSSNYKITVLLDHLPSCLLFIEVDKGAKTSLRFIRYTWHWPKLWYPSRKGDVFKCRKIAVAQIWMRHDLNKVFTAQTRLPLLNSDDSLYIFQFKHYLKDEFCHSWDWELMSQILCNLRHSGKFMIHVLTDKARRHKNK